MNDVQTKFIVIAVPAAQACELATDVPACITLAQCILESGWLQHMPAGSNNPFGIKAEHKDQPDTYVEAMTTEYENGVKVHVMQPFQKYASLEEAFIDHGRLLSKSKRYAPAMAKKKDPAEFATQLQKCGYSTSPTYAESLDFGDGTWEQAGPLILTTLEDLDKAVNGNGKPGLKLDVAEIKAVAYASLRWVKGIAWALGFSIALGGLYVAYMQINHRVVDSTAPDSIDSQSPQNQSAGRTFPQI